MSHTTELFIVAAVWTVVAVFIARTIPNLFARVAVGALLIGIPFWELPYGYYNFARLCHDEARVLILDKVVPQESICVDDLYSDVHRTLVGVGFSRIEMRGGTNLDLRDKAARNIVRAKRGEEKSLYCFSTRSNVHLPWRILRHDNLIVLATDGREVARQSSFNWAGMWWQESVRPILGNGGRCGSPLAELFNVVRGGPRLH